MIIEHKQKTGETIQAGMICIGRPFYGCIAGGPRKLYVLVIDGDAKPVVHKAGGYTAYCVLDLESNVLIRMTYVNGKKYADDAEAMNPIVENYEPVNVKLVVE